MPLPRFEIKIALFLLAFIVIGGTLGYHLLEHWNYLDSLYMTVITLATVGFREIGPISEVTKVFTIILIFAGVSTATYVMASITQFLVEGELGRFLGRKKVEKTIQRQKNHFIVCGFGRIGRIVSQQLKEAGHAVIIIEKDFSFAEELEKENHLFIIGDATNEDTLFQANITSAAGLVATTSSDADNLFLVMTARGISPHLFILARALDEHSEKKLLRVGATRVVSPYYIGGMRMAQNILKPNVCDFLDMVNFSKDLELDMEEVPVSEKAPIVGLSLKDSEIRQKYDIIILGIKRVAGSMIFNPNFEEKIKSGDVLIILGPRNNRDKLIKDIS